MLITKVMHHYSMPLGSVLETTTRVFFWLYRQIERHQAEKDRRQAFIMASVNSDKAFEELLKSYEIEMGDEIYEWERIAVPKPGRIEIKQEDDGELDPEFDRAGLHALKAKFCS